MESQNTTASANATLENSVSTRTKEKNKIGKTTTTGVMNSQVVKMLAGDEIARLAHRCEPLIGSKHAEVGEMIAEKLADQAPDVKAMLLAALVKIEQASTPGELAKQWVDWREEKAQVKEAEEEKRKLEAEAKKLAKNVVGEQSKAAKSVTPSFPGQSPAGLEAKSAVHSQSGAPPLANPEKPLATAAEQIGL